jgi:quercetin dioxygenase-like cupin family protein
LIIRKAVYPISFKHRRSPERKYAMQRLWTTLTALASLVAAVSASAEPAKHETVTPLVQQDLPNVPGKTFTSAIVAFPPGSRAAPHRHGQAFVFAYVLEGTVHSQLGDEPVRTYATGQSWSEPPGAHHVVTENVSATVPAKLLVMFISDTGQPLKSDDAKGQN